ncbi:IclR family transcriptional regulator [Amycolatopsis taiwanensis]|uniref:Glycerol operon regulatory protein n=1 Tax=Amycolatopsis taiwanensis TaxID=342230 RepID=A0A9W6RA78_9PSEU|nr:IclR family transcriptional regulator [Amycolatopsis taiwanensis]GLY70377.1 IclR family transcriptional regulator [Amycolatopsis taiwanensis]
MPEKAGAAGEPVRVLVKAMAVLELLAEAPEELSLGDIAARLNLNKSTCHRILTTLAAGDFVERPSAGSYRLGIGAFRIGSAMARRLSVRDRALPAMRDVYRKTGETVFLLVLRGDEAVCLERLDGRYAATHTLRVGGTLPLYLGAGPRLLLAHLPENQFESYLAGPFQRRISASQPTEAQLREQLSVIRQDGYSASRDDVEEGVTALSVPVRDHLGAIVAALSLSGLSSHLTESERPVHLRDLFDAAAEASRAMGFRDHGRPAT